MRYSRRVDNNQANIVRALREAGYTVTDFHRAGNGIPDLLVEDNRVGHFSAWVEVKEPGKKLTPDEEFFWNHAPGAKLVIYSAEEAPEALAMARAVAR